MLLISLTLQAVPGEDRGTAMGIYQGVYAIGMISGPAVCGYFADAVSLEAVFYLLAVISSLSALGGLRRVIPSTE
jgi:DHA1 family multidrug resistance protein-like MFS transporter